MDNRALKELRLNIGGIIISIASETDKQGFEFVEGFKDFFISRSKRADILLRIHYELPLPYKLEEKVFGDGAWSLHRCNGKYIFHFASFSPDSNPYNVAILGPDFQSGDIYINLKEENQEIKDENRKIRFPLRDPFGEILIISFLSLGRGVLLHACGISDNGKGLLFVGSSGAGKSTLANLWKDKKDVSILSDDRTIIRNINGRLWIYGTPWRGEANLSSAEGAPLDKIFFIKHAEKNTIAKIVTVEPVSRLITCSFPTFWDKKGMEFTLKFCAELAQRISCYELGFVPDESALNFIRSKV